MAVVLLVEDDRAMQILTRAKLKNQFSVICAGDGEEALQVLLRQHVDLIVADVMMPKMDGYTLVKTLREEGNEIPVLLLTAKQSFEDKRQGFSSGIDDYMSKPVQFEELIWRINALLRRAKISNFRKIVIGKLSLDWDSHMVVRGETCWELPRKEFELLFRLLSYPGQIFTRKQLMDAIWGYESESGEDTVKTHISRLRNRFQDVDEFSIVTVKGLGYKGLIREEEQL